MKIFLLGNCQVNSHAALLQVAGEHEIEARRISQATGQDLDPARLSRFDMILVQGGAQKRVADAVRHHPRVVNLPVLLFNGFTPDDEWFVVPKPGHVVLLMSRIAVGAWRHGLTLDDAMELYSPRFCDLMQYPEMFATARRNLIGNLAPEVPEIEQLFDRWSERGPFFLTFNHPRLFIVEDVLRAVLQREGLDLPRGVSELCPDPLLNEEISPQYNHPAAVNLVSDPGHFRKKGGRMVSCRSFLETCYHVLGTHRSTVAYHPPSNAQFDTAITRWRRPAAAVKAVNPYRSQPPRAYWARAVARPAMEEVRPIGRTAPLIGRETRVATAGSCFAQHVARAMVADGLTYHVAEPAPEGMDAETAEARTYGLFSARYGNIYCSRQLLQLIRRAYGRFTPRETAWPVRDGFIDPFRPNIGEVFETPEAVAASREDHLARVREMFESLDVFVFTMGLTESWVDRRDGAAFPVAPGAVSSGVDPADFGFMNGDYATIRSEMTEFLAELARVNPKARVILTVSPVPLIATYTETDALSATTYSKAVLRAVAGDLAERSAQVFYFPSFEIITGTYTRGAYFEDDLRSVRAAGVEHVMRVFRELLVVPDQAAPVPGPGPETPDTAAEPDAEYQRELNVVCDEELLVR